MGSSESIAARAAGAEQEGAKSDWNEAARRFILLSTVTFGILLFTLIGLWLQREWVKEPIMSMKGLAPSMSSHFFADLLRMEVPGLPVDKREAYTFSNSNVFGFLVHLLTDVNIRDTRSYVASQIPGIREDIVPLKGQGGQPISPVDYAPSTDGTAGGSPSSADTGDVHVDAGQEPLEIVLEEEPDTPTGNGEQARDLTTSGRKVVFIYHSHSRESWLPELKDKGITEARYAEDPEINITMVGERLAEQLEERGIGASQSKIDYPTEVKGYNWNFSYKYSHQTVVSAMADNQDLTYFFDIHRDSQRRELTTTEINGQSYAQVYFIIGMRNKNWEKNEAFATELHNALEEKYPGLSRGIWGKGQKDGNGEYNQSLSENSVVVEVGGPENSLEESYRTADALAEVISELYWQAERVNADG